MELTILPTSHNCAPQNKTLVSNWKTFPNCWNLPTTSNSKDITATSLLNINFKVKLFYPHRNFKYNLNNRSNERFSKRENKIIVLRLRNKNWRLISVDVGFKSKTLRQRNRSVHFSASGKISRLAFPNKARIQNYWHPGVDVAPDFLRISVSIMHLFTMNLPCISSTLFYNRMNILLYVSWMQNKYRMIYRKTNVLQIPRIQAFVTVEWGGKMQRNSGMMTLLAQHDSKVNWSS